MGYTNQSTQAPLTNTKHTYKFAQVQPLLAQLDVILEPLDALAYGRVVVFFLRLLCVLDAELALPSGGFGIHNDRNKIFSTCSIMFPSHNPHPQHLAPCML